MGRFLVTAGVCLLLSSSVAYAEVEDVRTFVTTQYIHGVPYEAARAYGSEAIPLLQDLLRDRDLADYWDNIVRTLGYIGDPQASPILTGFLSELHGEVTVQEFRAALSVPAALGHLAQGDEQALMTLQQLADEVTPEGTSLAFSYKRYAGAALSEVMGRMAIQGLGISGTPEALAFLESRQESARPDWSDNYSEAIALNRRVAAEGAREVFAQ